MSNNTSENKLGVYVRWRPLDESETTGGQIEQTSTAAGDTRPPFSISVNPQAPGNPRPWTSPPAFRAVLGPGDDNAHAYESIVAPAIPQILRGRSCNFFAYGHSGSGKTHTIIGYDYEEGSGKLGLCLAAGQRLFEALDSLNDSGGDGDGDGDGERRLGLGFSLFELRKNTALDLLNGRTACHVREGPDGRTHIRGPTETLAGGRSELVPAGKRATDVSIEEQMRALVRGPDGAWAPNPDYRVDQARIDEAEAEKARCEARVAAAEARVSAILSSSSSDDGTAGCLGGKMVFVDLAGAEYQAERGAQTPLMKAQTPQERQEGRQINTDLLALKEVIRAWSTGQARIPFRLSPLTMVLREHFVGAGDGTSAMIVTVSPAKDQYPATLNSLKYGSLVGTASS